MLTKTQVDAGALYDMLLSVYARGNFYDDETMALVRRLIEDNTGGADKAAFLAFLDAAKESN